MWNVSQTPPHCEQSWLNTALRETFVKEVVSGIRGCLGLTSGASMTSMSACSPSIGLGDYVTQTKSGSC